MYSVSADYLTALKTQVHTYKLNGNINNTSFDEDDIISLSVSNRCANDGEVTIGSVFTAELKITFLKGLGISWANSKGWAITISEGLMLADESFEYVPIGVFYIEEVNETKDGIEITAYDAMLKFDKKVGDISTKARLLPDLIDDICDDVGITLATADFTDFPNYNSSFTLSKDNDITTDRDLLSWCVQTLGAYATINRSGELEVRAYPNINTITDTINADARSDNYTFNFYSTTYTGIFATDNQRQETKYYHVEPDDGLTYNIGVNPFFQNINANRFKVCSLAILNAIQSINYSPFNIQLLPTAVYDLGDILKFTDGAGGNKIGCLMLFDYTYNQSVTLEGLGSDPALATAQSKTDKNLEGILKNTDSNKEYIYSFQNDQNIILDNTWQTIFSERFGAVDNTHAIFQAELLCDDPNGSVTEVRYLLDGNIVSYYPIETWIAGKHILSLYYLLDVQSDTFYNFVMQMRSDASVTIDAFDGRGSIRGQGLASTEAWDGYINIEENYSLLSVSDTYSLNSFSDGVSAVLVDYVPISVSESYDLLTTTEDSQIVDYESVIGFDGEALSLLTWDEAKQMTWEYVESAYVWGYNDSL